jgi:hypothetical protein
LCTPRAPLLLTRILRIATVLSKVGIGLAWRPGSKFASRDECSEKIYCPYTMVTLKEGPEQ